MGICPYTSCEKHHECYRHASGTGNYWSDCITFRGVGESLDQHSPGAKLDQDKPDCSLLGTFGLALTEVSKVGTFGTRKYTRDGWQSVEDAQNRYTAAMLRHYFQEGYSERDEDSEMYHIAQVAWNALARLELFLREKKQEEKR